MARIEFPDGSEIYTEDDESADVDDGKFAAARRRIRARKEPNDGLTRRQRGESALKKVGSTIWDYVSGDGDDLDRLLRTRRRLRGELGDAPEPGLVLPDDDD